MFSFVQEKYTNGDTVYGNNARKTYINYEGRDFVEIEKGILHEAENALVFCVGNIHGPGGRIAEFIEGIE